MKFVVIVLAAVAFIAMVAVIIRLRSERNRYRRKASRMGSAAPETVIKQKIEFSKLILLLVMLAYFVVVAIGVWLSLLDPMQFSTLAMLVGAPTAVAIGFYAWKAKAENVLKYHKDNKDETGDVPFDPGSIT